MRVLLVVTAFNGLSQRVWDELRARGHHVTVSVHDGPASVVAAALAAEPDLVLCPYLKERVPAEVWRNWPTVILHPGPVGDQGPSSLDRAIVDAQPVWGVTAFGAAEEFDGGPIWACHTFDMPTDPPRKSAVYGGLVTAAAVACVLDVMERAVDPAFRPTPLQEATHPVPGTARRPVLSQADRRFDWASDSESIVRRIRAADGFPGVRTVLAGHEVSVFDARPGTGAGVPGEIVGRCRGQVLVATGSGAVWIGQARRVGGIKLPATTVLPVADVPDVRDGPQDVSYRREGAVGHLSFSFYNGAAGVDQCRRLEAALRCAAQQDTQVLVLRSGPDVFCTGIHLGEIEYAADPATAAWDNIRAINGVCRALIEIKDQITIAAFTGPAAAGGVMLGLGADVVVGRSGVMLNPYYDIGLHGSELHTLTLPHRVGHQGAATFLSAKLPISTDRAAAVGLVDLVGPADPGEFGDWLDDVADRYTDPAAWRGVIYSRISVDRPLDYYESLELAEMARDLYDDRHGFAAARRAFVDKNRLRSVTDGLVVSGDRTDFDDFIDENSLRDMWGLAPQQ